MSYSAWGETEAGRGDLFCWAKSDDESGTKSPYLAVVDMPGHEQGMKPPAQRVKQFGIICRRCLGWE
jgi:hypothetical protein